MSRSPVALVLGAVLLMSCSGGDDASIAEAPTTTSTSSTATTVPISDSETTSPPDPAAADSSAPVSSAPARAATTTAPETVPVDTGEPFGEAFDVPDVDQLTAVSGGGSRPLLEWAPVENAAGYMVWVYTPDGQPYWSWMGPDTATHLGGPLEIADDRPGPRVIDGMSWVVVAVDADLEFLAVSEQRWIGP